MNNLLNFLIRNNWFGIEMKRRFVSCSMDMILTLIIIILSNTKLIIDL